MPAEAARPTRRVTLAVALIVKNEAQNLAACLDSVAGWVDEIVILDSGSTDATEQIARRYTQAFYTSSDWPGFGPQRQRAQTHVTADWILWLDADERVTPELRASIQAVLQNPPDNTIYQVARLSWAFGQFIRHCGWYPGHVERLHPRGLTQYDNALVHESLVLPPAPGLQRCRVICCTLPTPRSMSICVNRQATPLPGQNSGPPPAKRGRLPPPPCMRPRVFSEPIFCAWAYWMAGLAFCCRSWLPNRSSTNMPACGPAPGRPSRRADSAQA